MPTINSKARSFNHVFFQILQGGDEREA